MAPWCACRPTAASLNCTFQATSCLQTRNSKRAQVVSCRPGTAGPWLHPQQYIAPAAGLHHCTHHTTPCPQAGDGRRAQVVTCSQGATSALRLDQLCHSAVCSTAGSQEELSQLLQLRLGQYTEASGYGLLLLLWSVLLSHSVE